MLAAKSGGATGDFLQQLGPKHKRQSDQEFTFIDDDIKSGKRLVDQLEIIKINISGILFEASTDTLNRFPDSLLGNPERRAPFYNPEKDEYFFDRHAPSFDAILYYYQSGGYIHKPGNVPKGVFRQEIMFFDILKEESEDFQTTQEKIVDTIKPRWRRWLYQLIDVPESSPAAKIFGIVSLVIILTSTIEFCIETLPDLAVYKCLGGGRQKNRTIEPILVSFPQNLTGTSTNQSADLKMQEASPPSGSYNYSSPNAAEKCVLGFDIFHVVETICVAWFTAEFILRLISTPSLCCFLKSFMNWIDAVAIVPYYVNLVIKEQGAVASLAILRVLRLARIMRIFKLSRHLKGIKVLGKTMGSSWRELVLLVFFLLIALLISGTALYFAETSGAVGSEIRSIPDACWVCIITLTTVGYGDVVPLSTLGKMVAGICAVMGAIVLALPISVVVGNFKRFYDEEHQLELKKINPNLIEDDDSDED